jgi:hypothetical protein
MGYWQNGIYYEDIQPAQPPYQYQYPYQYFDILSQLQFMTQKLCFIESKLLELETKIDAIQRMMRWK